jgi:hypothetical protein
MTSGNWSATGGWSTSVTAVNWAYVAIAGTNYVADGTTNTTPTNAIPTGMTANSTVIGGITYVASADTEYGTSNRAWAAFDNNNTATGWTSIDTVCPHALMFDFGSGNAKCINTFKYYPYISAGYAPKAWLFQGTNNTAAAATDAVGANGWITLLDSSVANPSGVSDSGGNYTPLFPFTNGVVYRYYRLYITASWFATGRPYVDALFLGLAQTQSATPTFTQAALTYTTATIQNLSQSVSVTTGATYQVQFTTSGVGAGSVTPEIGGTLGTGVSAAQSNTQYILATNTGALNFIPTTDFNGSIDNVSVTQITSGSMAGSYMIDSIAPTIPIIDDTIVSAYSGWSSLAIMQAINNALGVSGTTSVFNAQKTGGLGLLLQYVNSTTVQLIPVVNGIPTGQTSYVVFPDGSNLTVPAAGINLTVSGAANTRYYVYLSSSGLAMNTTPPDGLYTKLETLGTANIQVGDICLTSTMNTMSGAWNVCSSSQEPSRLWSTPINAATITLILTGLMFSKRATGVTSSSGTTEASIYQGLYHDGTCNYAQIYCTAANSPQSGSVSDGGCTNNSTLTITLGGSFHEGINTSYPTYSDSLVTGGVNDEGAYAGGSIISRTGNLVLIRSQS